MHGSEGLGIRLPEPTLEPHRLNAVEFIRDRVSRSPGQVVIIAIGPLTNVAAAMSDRPDIAEAVSEIVVMGGAVGVPGNITPHAEFNIHEDPWAANAVFTSGVPVTLVGLDVTHQTFMHRSDGPAWFEGTSSSAQLGNRILSDRFRELADEQEFHLARSAGGGGGNRPGCPDVPPCSGLGGDGREGAWPHRRKLRRRAGERGGWSRCRAGRRDRSTSSIQLAGDCGLVPRPSPTGHPYNGQASV